MIVAGAAWDSKHAKRFHQLRRCPLLPQSGDVCLLSLDNLSQRGGIMLQLFQCEQSRRKRNGLPVVAVQAGGVLCLKTVECAA